MRWLCVLFSIFLIIPTVVMGEANNNIENRGDVYEKICEYEGILEIRPGEKYVFFYNSENRTSYEHTKITRNLSNKCKQALTLIPEWMRNYVERNFIELGASSDKFADLIINSPKKEYVDEIASVIAFASPDMLSAMRHPSLLTENAKLIYEIGKNLSYVEFIEKDEYTTLKYNVSINGQQKYIEIPKEIYYRYVVFPSVTGEAPAYINPDNGRQANPPTGRFWREYLYYHNDSSYPPDPKPDKCYPKDEPPPLLKNVLNGTTYVWDFVPYKAPAGYDDYGHNNRRPWDYKDHVMEKISNWVEKTLPLNEQESGDRERPIQPVRIAHHHNGNCGELQDLSVAAARTVLIPSIGALNFGEDHVWQEFYLDRWYHWDNWWSDGGTGIDVPETYEEGWHRELSGVILWHPDDFVNTSSVNYTNLSRIVISVVDSDGKPVDGAWVRLAVDYYYDPQSPYKMVFHWNVTDSSGKTEFLVGDNRKIMARVDSDTYGSGSPTSHPSNTGTPLILLSKDLKTIVQNTQTNKTYKHTFVINKVHPKKIYATEITTPPQSEYERYMWKISFNVDKSIVRGKSITGRHYLLDTNKSKITAFMCDKYNYSAYISHMQFSAWNLVSTTSHSLTYKFDGNDDIYFVMSNEEACEVRNIVTYKIEVYGKPYIKIEKPESGKIISEGDVMTIEGYADAPGIHSLLISKDGRENFENYTYGYDIYTKKFRITLSTEGMSGGDRDIVVRIGYKEKIYDETVTIYIDAHDPVIEVNPINDVYPSDSIVNITGKCTDDVAVGKLEIKIGERGKWKDITKNLVVGVWGYEWNTWGLSTETYTIYIRATDSPAGRQSTVMINITIDSEPPTNTISIEKGVHVSPSVYRIRGTCSDDVGVETVKVRIAEEERYAVIENDSWYIDWNFTTYQTGDYTIIAVAEDKVNRTTEAVSELFVDASAPIIEVESHEYEKRYSIKKVIEMYGTVEDDSDIEILEVHIGDGLFNITDSIEDGEWSFSWEPPSMPGNYTLMFHARDIMGNDGYYNFTVVLIDMVPPEGRFIKPPKDTTIAIGENVKIEGLATDDCQILGVYISFGDEWIEINITEDRWEYIWETSSLEPGVYKIKVKVVDVGGNSIEMKRRVMLVDSVEPTVEILKPEVNAQFNYGTEINVECKIDDNVGILSARIQIDEGMWINVTDEIINGTLMYSIKDLTPGVHTIKIEVVDVGKNHVERKVTITIKEKETSGVASINNNIVLGGIVGIIVILALISFIIMRGRKKPPMETVDKPADKPKTDAEGYMGGEYVYVPEQRPPPPPSEKQNNYNM